MVNILQFLEGEWELNRFVSALAIEMQGKAVFLKESSQKYHYNESGSYFFENVEYNFFQNFEFLKIENKLIVVKKDGVILHEFSLPKTIQFPIKLFHKHCCGSDFYECSFEIQKLNYLLVSYNVFGPNKKYSIETKMLKKHFF